ncbi:efflux RND transporter permease subunit, partial [Acinetobacter baumannii]
YGLNTGDVNAVVQTALGGSVVTAVLEGERQYGLSVRFAGPARASIERIRDLRVSYNTGSGTGYVPLREIATIGLDTGATYIYHERNERYI